jgi:copper chaperone
MKYQFKTDINCGGCVQAVTPYLDANNEIKHWHVDFNGPEKILTVETESLSDEMIRQIVKKAGYKAEPLDQ